MSALCCFKKIITTWFLSCIHYIHVILKHWQFGSGVTGFSGRQLVMLVFMVQVLSDVWRGALHEDADLQQPSTSLWRRHLPGSSHRGGSVQHTGLSRYKTSCWGLTAAGPSNNDSCITCIHKVTVQTQTDARSVGCDMCCPCCLQRAGPTGPSGPTATPVATSCVCVTATSCSPLETSAQETAVRHGPVLRTPTSYQVIPHERSWTHVGPTTNTFFVSTPK